jgi:hypothetical protein
VTTALGLVPHTGWTWLVRVDGDAVTARDRVVALPVHDAELYHLARDHRGDRATFFAARRAGALARAIDAVRAPCRGAARAIVLGKQPALPELDRIVASHAAIHGAEGELWRALFAEACARCDVAVERAAIARPGEARWLASAGDALGPPWTKEIKDAAAAARAIAGGGARTGWTCPECKRRFGRANQSHECAPGQIVDEFFADRPEALRRVYDAIARHLATLDGVHADAVTACIMFKRARTFAEVRTKKHALVLIFLLSRELDDERFDRVLRTSANRWAHFVSLAAARDVDRDVRGWLTEAYASSPE